MSVLIPTLDEAANMNPLLGAILEHARAASLDLEVIVVDDGSRDGTREIVRTWGLEHPVKLLCRDGERGLATAVLAGASIARGDVVIVMDADLSHPPEKIADLARPVLEGSSDMVIGSRYVPGGSTPGWPLLRRVVSRAAAASARLLVDARDPLSGYFAVRRDRLLAAGKDATGFKIGLEVLLRAEDGLRVEEVPIAFKDRTAGDSKLGARVMALYLKQLACLAGASAGSRIGPACLVGFAVDLGSFHALLAAGIDLVYAQLGSFFTAALATFILCRRSIPRHVGAVLAFGSVSVLAATLRGGLLVSLVREMGWHPSLAICPAILIGGVVMYLGCIFLVFPAAGASSASVRWRVGAIGVLVYCVALRLAYVDLVNLMPQEAYYWNYSEHLDLGYLDHPPMTAWLIWAASKIFGRNELAVRISALACWGAAAVFSFLLVKHLLDRSTAFRAVLLMGILPFFFGIGFFMTPDAPVVAFWAGTLYFLERALLAGRKKAWIGAGACLGLGLLSKYPILLLCPAALLFILVDSKSRRWLLRPEPYVAFILGLILFSPVILWNYKNDWASFVFQGPRRFSEEARFALPELLGSMILIITPMGLLAFWFGISKRRTSLGAIAGAFKTLDGRKRLFILVFTLVPLTVFVLASLHSETKLQWTGPVWLAGLPAMALGMMAGRDRIERWLAALWRPALIAVPVMYGIAFHIPSLGLPGIRLPSSYYTMNWQDLGRQIEEIEMEVISETGAEPLIVGLDKYHLSSELAFYDPAQDGAFETAGVHLFGKRSLMYSRWFPEAAQGGKSLVLVSSDEKDMNRQDVLQRVERLEPVRELTVSRGSSVVAHYYARVAHGYRTSPEP